MKRIFLVFVLLIGLVVHSQEVKFDSEASFVYQVHLQLQLVPEEYDSTLNFDNQQSLCSWVAVGNTSLQTTSNGTLTSAAHFKDGEWNYVNKTKNQILSKVAVDATEAYITEQEAHMQWDIDFDTQQKLHGYHCYKATTNYGGRHYTAWFTTEIPTAFGPWKFNNLPGLIIEVSDKEKQFAFRLKEVHVERKTNTVSYGKLKVVSLEKYYQRVVDKPFESIKATQAKVGRGATISISSTNWNFIEKNYEYLGRDK
ncbi:MAG: GLPGLI family protein [Bacteroidota bacterium]|nr:GLPGLI family protein [Bacteroidota bacterium]